jgi:hypothetical protein
MGITLTPKEVQPRKGSQILRICFWRGAERLHKRRNPRKARFFAEQKMRPNNALHGEALYSELFVKKYRGLDMQSVHILL